MSAFCGRVAESAPKRAPMPANVPILQPNAARILPRHAKQTRMTAAAPIPEDLLGGTLPEPDARLDAHTRWAAVAMTLFFWAANTSVQMYRSWLDQVPHLDKVLLSRLIIALAGGALCYGIHLVLAALGKRPFRVRATVLVLIVPVAADLCAWISYFVTRLVAPHLMTGGGASSSATIQAVLYWVWFFLAWGALYLALRYSFEVQASERRARLVQGLAHAAQMRALQNQINPHFMFNTLNSISALMLDGRVAEAETMLRGLSDFLRATLSLDPLADITLSEELRTQSIYLGIERARFPDMEVLVDCPKQLANAMVPALITQPIVENAVKYGVARALGPTRIAIEARERDGHLVLAVRDNGPATSTEAGKGLGVGLRNVRDRLISRFGCDHGFAAGALPQGGFRVEMSMPLTRAKA